MGGPATIQGIGRLTSTDNFLVAPMRIPCVVVNGTTAAEQPVEWKTVEHFFQAVKFDSVVAGRAVWEHCRAIQQDADSALDAWELGQSRDFPLRADWETVKGHAMYVAVRHKYEQYPAYAEEFCRTTGKIHANASTSNWQWLNAVVLERIRYELRRSAGLTPLVDEHQYGEWCRQTSLPAGSRPLQVYLTASDEDAKKLAHDKEVSATEKVGLPNVQSQDDKTQVEMDLA